MMDVAMRVDARFASSAWETRSQSEQDWMASWLEQMGNIELLMLVIGAVVFFTLLLVTGNTMAMSVRERYAEMAVLKNRRFQGPHRADLVLSEACLIALAGGRARRPPRQALHPRRRSDGRLPSHVPCCPRPPWAPAPRSAMLVGLLAVSSLP
jgi:hypothetical protein